MGTPMTSPERLADQLADALAPVLGEVEIRSLRRLTGGASRETWSFDAVTAGDDLHELVLRRDPPARPGPPGSMSLEAAVIRLAGAAGVPMSTHLYPEVAAHVMRVTETAHWLEWQDWADPILQRPYVIKDGRLHIPDVPGIGLEWDESAVKANRVDF